MKGSWLIKKEKKIRIIYSLISLTMISVILFMLYLNSWHQKQYFLDNIQYPLVELQGILQQQETEGWNNPQIVSNQLNLILDDLWYGTASHTFPSKGLSKEEMETIQKIASALNQLPTNSNYQLSTWTEEDIKKAQFVNQALIKAELKMENTISVDWDYFMAQCEILQQELLFINQP